MEFYTYAAYYRGILVYLGKGVGKRVAHVTGGKSGSELINDFHFRNVYFKDMELEPKVVSYHTTAKAALRAERSLIQKYKPFCNKTTGRFHSEEYPFKDKLKLLALNMGYTPPEVLKSKFDFRFLFTPKGLFCRVVDIGVNSVFEQDGFYVKVKSELHSHFPEFALQYAKFNSEVIYSLIWNMGVYKYSLTQMDRDVKVFKDVVDDSSWWYAAIEAGSFKGYHITEHKVLKE